MAPPRGAWAWGTPAERESGGYAVRLLWDSVLPYTRPAPLPPWWPAIITSGGQFPGYERNMAESGGKAGNVPANRHLNAVLIAMLAFKQSDVAPLRLTANSTGDLILNEADRQWPFEPTVVGGVTVPAATAIEPLAWYINNYAEPETKLIIMIPGRDVINALAAPTSRGGLSIDGLN